MGVQVLIRSAGAASILWRLVGQLGAGVDTYLLTY
jgi:hypothetical protein